MNDLATEDVKAMSFEAALTELEGIVARLEGTNVKEGKEILANSGLPIVSADNLAGAAQKVVDATEKAQKAA